MTKYKKIAKSTTTPVTLDTVKQTPLNTPPAVQSTQLTTDLTQKDSHGNSNTHKATQPRHKYTVATQLKEQMVISKDLK